MSARLLADWKMPHYVYCSVLHRDDVNYIGGAGTEGEDRKGLVMLKILRWASGMADILTAPPESLERSLKPKAARLSQQLGKDEARFAQAFNGSIKNWQVYGRLLNVETREVPPWPEILTTGA